MSLRVSLIASPRPSAFVVEGHPLGELEKAAPRCFPRDRLASLKGSRICASRFKPRLTGLLVEFKSSNIIFYDTSARIEHQT